MRARFHHAAPLAPFAIALALAVFPAHAQPEAPDDGPEEGRDGPDAGAIIGDGAQGLQVIVGPGGQSLEELAVQEVQCLEGATVDLCRLASGTLRRDMTLSFVFQVLPERSYLADPSEESLAEPSWAAWTNIGARFLIKGEIKGDGPWRVELRFYNVTQNAGIELDEQSARVSSKAQLRAAVHRFANAVVGARTDTAGVFGTEIAYDRRAAVGVKVIGTCDMDGHGCGSVISNGHINMLPAWGFGGMLYTSFADGAPQLYFGKRQLSRDAGHYRSVAVSPDGARMIASISYGGQSDLYLMQKDGAVIRNLTNTAADEVSPTFSPDGGRVAFVSSAAGGPQIYMMSAEGGDMTRLTHAGSYNYSPDWGPQGLIVFAGMEDGVSDIFTVDEQGSIRRLTQDQGSNKDPTWSPDGRYVAFYGQRSEGSGLYIMSADGRYQTLVAKGFGYGNLAWQR